MELKDIALVLVDISGYTRFLRLHGTSVLHAEQIITELLEAIIDTAQYPLELNKLEGDTALLYRPLENNPSTVAKDVAQQALRFFEAFKAKQQALIVSADGGCVCEACGNIDQLSLKAFLHLGQVVIKRVRQFEELAGEDVILIHRLLKNQIEGREYLAMTKVFYAQAGELPDLQMKEHIETYEQFGPVKLAVFVPKPKLTMLDLPQSRPMSKSSGIRENLRLWKKDPVAASEGSAPCVSQPTPLR